MWGPLIGAAASLGGALLSNRGSNNPAQAAQPHLQRIPEYGYNAYNPFIAQGQRAEEKLYPEYERMAYSPVDWLRNMEGQYQETPFYKYQYDKLMKSAGNTAAAGGYMGTDEDIRNRSEMMQALLSGDMQQYLSNIFNISGQGRGGLETRTGRGFQAASNLADYLGGVEGHRANYAALGNAYAGENQQNVWNALSNLINVGVGTKERPGVIGQRMGMY